MTCMMAIDGPAWGDIFDSTNIADITDIIEFYDIIDTVECWLNWLSLHYNKVF